MKKERNAFKAGLFIVISIALILGVIVAINGVGTLVEPDQVRTATFALGDDVGGVRVGDDVRVGGVKVGIVRSINIQPATDGKGDPTVVIHFNMPRRLTLRDGARIGVQTTLTGGAWLNFRSLGTGQPLPDDRILKGEPGFYTTLTNTIDELGPEIKALAHDIRTVTLPKVNDTAENAKQLTGDLRARVENIVERYNVVVQRLTEVMTNLRDILGDTKPDIRGALANINAASGSLKEKLPVVLDDFDKLMKKVNAELDSTTGVLADIKATVVNLRDATGSARSLLVTNRSKLDDMIASLKTAGDNLKFATAEIRHSPWRLLYKPHPGEVANLNLYDSTRLFAEGANDMSAAATALRDALNDPKADKAKIEQLARKLDDSFAEFQKVEGDLWKRVKE